MRDPFKGRTIEDLAMQYALMTGPNPPSKMYSAYDVHKELMQRVGVDRLQDHVRDARAILQMVSADEDYSHVQTQT